MTEGFVMIRRDMAERVYAALSWETQRVTTDMISAARRELGVALAQPEAQRIGTFDVTRNEFHLRPGDPPIFETDADGTIHFRMRDMVVYPRELPPAQPEAQPVADGTIHDDGFITWNPKKHQFGHRPKRLSLPTDFYLASPPVQAERPETMSARELAKRVERGEKWQPVDRPCTCHPDDNPPQPCPKKYALSECRQAAQQGEQPCAYGQVPSVCQKSPMSCDCMHDAVQTMDTSAERVEKSAGIEHVQGEPSDDPERAMFYATIEAAEQATGHKPPMFDVWLMARGVMDPTGRRISAQGEPSDEALIEAAVLALAERDSKELGHSVERLLRHHRSTYRKDATIVLNAARAVLALRPQPVEPSDEPDDEEIMRLWGGSIMTGSRRTHVIAFARAVLALKPAVREPLSEEYIEQHIGPDEDDREAVTAIVREVEQAHGIAAAPQHRGA